LLRKLLRRDAVLALALAVTLALAPATLANVFDFPLEQVYGLLGAEDTLCDLELATRTNVALVVFASRTRNGAVE